MYVFVCRESGCEPRSRGAGGACRSAEAAAGAAALMRASTSLGS